jgi:hypothetical protein
MRKYYSLVRFDEKKFMPGANSQLQDAGPTKSPTMRVYRDMDDPTAVVVEMNGAKNEYPWSCVKFARLIPEQPAEPAAKKGKG